MIVAAVSVRVKHLKLRKAQHRGTSVVSGEQPVVAVRVESDSGAAGYGEASAWANFAGSTAIGSASIVEHILGPAILNTEVQDARGRSERLMDAIPEAAIARAAVDMACWDLAAQAVRLPLHSLLGSSGRRFELSHSLSGLCARDVAVEARELTRRGFSVFKLKMGGRDYAIDTERLRALRTECPDAIIRVDFNEKGTAHSLRKLADTFVQTSVDFVEQPLNRHAWEALRELRKWFPVRLALDESITSGADVRRAGNEGLCDVVALKLGRAGGIHELTHLARVANDFGMSVYPGALNETRLGMLASAHAFSAVDVLTSGCDFYFPMTVLDDGDVDGGFELTGQSLSLPERPGIGASFGRWF